MARWLMSALLLIAFLALAIVAILPSSVTVNIDIDSNATSHHETTENYNGPALGIGDEAEKEAPEEADQ